MCSGQALPHKSSVLCPAGQLPAKARNAAGGVLYPKQGGYLSMLVSSASVMRSADLGLGFRLEPVRAQLPSSRRRHAECGKAAGAMEPHRLP